MNEIKEQLDNGPIIITLSRSPKSKLEKRFWTSPIWRIYGLIRPRKYYRINVSKLSFGTFQRIASEIIHLSLPNSPIDNDYFFQVAARNSQSLAKILALAIWNRASTPPSKIEKWLIHNLTLKEFGDAFQLLREFMPVESFLKTISSVRTLSLHSEEKADSNIQKDGTEV